VHDNVKALTI